LWLVGDQDKLSTTAIQAIRDNAGKIFVSAISAFEVGVKWKKGLLLMPLPSSEWFALDLASHGLTELPVTSRVATRAILLPDHHNDPADRILIATAIENHLMLLTPDKHILAYPAQVLW
jgi:PIN domain nuclease of toxin-antitoxin system